MKGLLAARKTAENSRLGPRIKYFVAILAVATRNGDL